MKVLEPTPTRRLFKHTINKSCVIALCGDSSSRVIVLNEEDFDDVIPFKKQLVEFFSTNKTSQWKIVGVKSWVNKVFLAHGDLRIEPPDVKKEVEPGTVVMMDGVTAKLKIKPPVNSGAELKPKASVTEPIKVMVIDDSSTMRTVLRQVINSDPILRVSREAESAEAAFQQLESFKPDLITLDINLPGIDGVEFLKQARAKNISVPVLVITSLNLNDGDKVFEALQAGAIDYLQKPEMSELVKSQELICSKLKMAAGANIESSLSPTKITAVEPVSFPKVIGHPVPIFLGSSTGGTTAIERMLKLMTPPIPPVLITQHIPAVFSKAFAERLNGIYSFTVKEAEDGERIEENCVYIAPGGLQMGISPTGKEGSIHISIRDLPPVNRFKPSVDYLFESVAINHHGPKVAVILTGMGRDGAQGMKTLKEQGNIITIAQDESSSVVLGMPKAAIDLGCVDNVCHLDEIPKKLRDSISQLASKERKSA